MEPEESGGMVSGLAAIAVSIVFAACKKEYEEPINNSSPLIIGVWTINTLIIESDTSSETLFPEDIGFATSLDFITGGILYEYISNDIDTNEWVIIADSLYIGEDGEDFIGKHHVTATHLTLTGPLEENMSGKNTMIINGIRN